MALGPRDSARYSPYASPSALRGWKTKLREEFLPGANWCFFQRWRGPARGAVAAADAPCLEDRDELLCGVDESKSSKRRKSSSGLRFSAEVLTPARQPLACQALS